MPTVSEGAETTMIEAPLNDGVDLVSLGQEITFTKYVRLVLPFDGYVFWVRASIVSQSSIPNAGLFNSFQLNTGPVITSTPTTQTVKGSLHRAVDTKQNEDETMALNRVIFTTATEIDDFNFINPGVAWIGEIDGVQFSFSSMKNNYKAAGQWHYMGEAIFPAMRSQIVDDPRFFDVNNVVVSNSLPLWLRLNRYFPVYPSFLVPANVEPVYGVAHIQPGTTRAIQAAPYFDETGSQWQLVKEPVRITMYGTRNFNALDYVRYVQEAAMGGEFGIMNMPIVQDEKRTQNELNIIAMKKTVTFEIDYYQSRLRDESVKYILSCIPSFIVA